MSKLIIKIMIGIVLVLAMGTALGVVPFLKSQFVYEFIRNLSNAIPDESSLGIQG